MFGIKLTRLQLLVGGGVVAAFAAIAIGFWAWDYFKDRLPQTLGEQASGYGYVPLDGLAVSHACNASYYSGAQKLPLLPSLPDISSRFAVGEISRSGDITYGSSKTTIKDKSYKAVLDYVNVDTVPANLWIRKRVRLVSGKAEYRSVNESLSLGERVLSYEVDPYVSGYNQDTLGEAGRKIEVEVENQFQAEIMELESRGASVPTMNDIEAPPSPTPAPVKAQAAKLYAEMRAQQDKRKEALRTRLRDTDKYTLVTVPVYVGIGLRLTADVYSLKSGAMLDGLSGIAAQADADVISGTLTVQAIGINGKSIGSTLPMPSKLDSTTVETAIFALGSSRAFLYGGEEKEEAHPTARVVGLYSPLGSNPKIINAIYSFLAANRPVWQRSCDY